MLPPLHGMGFGSAPARPDSAVLRDNLPPHHGLKGKAVFTISEDPPSRAGNGEPQTPQTPSSPASETDRKPHAATAWETKPESQPVQAEEIAEVEPVPSPEEGEITAGGKFENIYPVDQQQETNHVDQSGIATALDLGSMHKPTSNASPETPGGNSTRAVSLPTSEGESGRVIPGRIVTSTGESNLATRVLTSHGPAETLPEARVGLTPDKAASQAVSPEAQTVRRERGPTLANVGNQSPETGLSGDAKPASANRTPSPLPASQDHGPKPYPQESRASHSPYLESRGLSPEQRAGTALPLIGENGPPTQANPVQGFGVSPLVYPARPERQSSAPTGQTQTSVSQAMPTSLAGSAGSWHSASASRSADTSPLVRQEALAAVQRAMEQFHASQRDNQAMTLRLPDGGTISLKLHLSGGILHSQFHTDVPGLEQALRAQWNEWSRGLEQKGMQLGDPSFQQQPFAGRQSPRQETDPSSDPESLAHQAEESGSPSAVSSGSALANKHTTGLHVYV